MAEPVSLESLQGWWENPWSQNGIGMLYVKGAQVFIGNLPVGNLTILGTGAGRKIKFGDYSGIVKPGGEEISWDGNRIIWKFIGELPDMHDPETKLGRFKYTRLLGKGANGVVCEAVDMHAASERKVAVKILRVSSLPSKKEIAKSAERMHMEYLWSHMFLHNTRHEHYNAEQGRYFLQYYEDHTGLPPAPKNVCLASEVHVLAQIDSSSKVARLPYVLMELAKGETSWKALFEHEKESASRFSTRDKRELLRQLLSAVAYLRKFQLVHGDLNFFNLFFSRANRRLSVAIGDFGMMSARTQANILQAGNLEDWKMRDWVPWEAWHIAGATNGRSKSPSDRCRSPKPTDYTEDSWQAFDIFSLGVLHLYMCLGQTETRRVLEHIRTENQTPALSAASSRKLILDADLALGMISKDPELRPMPYEVLTQLQNGGLFWSLLTCPSRACGSRAAPTVTDRSRSPRGRGIQVAKRPVYLPTELNGNKVLVSEGENTWRVTTRNLKAKPNTNGLGHRKTKNIDDHIAGGNAMAKWGERICGVDEGDGWVRCEV